MIITHKKIIDDYQAIKTAKIIYFIFTLIGIVVPLIPFLYLKTFDFDSIMSFVFLSLMFGLPFGYFIGLRNIINIHRINSSIKNNDIFIIESKITDKRMSPYNVREDDDSRYGQITIQNFNKVLYISSKEYEVHSEGEKCILIFSKYNKKYPVLKYLGNEYVVDELLKEKIV